MQIVDKENTGRIMYGSRYTNGLHEFLEVKEKIHVRPESGTIASISHPSFFMKYSEIYGLTGTLGEELEREEIKEMYNVTNFDVPPNRPCHRELSPTLIYKTHEEKHESIIRIIKEMQSKGRPTLVIVLTIEESLELSAKLRNAAIDHFVLNDKQSESEDFIVERAGRRSAVTVATNTAGRGTDIKLEKAALSSGGLHVVLAFFPVNLRVECQGLGRAGRQGLRGSCQLVIESEKYAVKSQPTATVETLKQMYADRTKSVQCESQRRKEHVQRDQKIFAILSEFFNYVEKMRKQLTMPKAIAVIKEKEPNIDPSFYAQLLHAKLQQKWTEFFTELESPHTKLDNENMFKQFIDEFWKEENMDPLVD